MSDTEQDMIERLKQLRNYCYAIGKCLGCEFYDLCNNLEDQDLSDSAPEFWDDSDISNIARGLLNE